MLFENLIQEWLQKGLQRYTSRTQLDYRKLSKYYLELHGLQLLEIDDRLLLRFFIRLSVGRKYKTIRNILSGLSSFFDYCICEGYAEINPCLNHTLTTRLRSHFRTASDKMKKQKHAINEQEAIKLLEGAYAITFEFGLAVEFLICTGMRLGELAALKPKDVCRFVTLNKNVNEITKELQLSCKWGSNGKVELPQPLYLKYLEYEKTNTKEWTFPYVRFYQKQFSKRLGRLSDRLSIAHTTAHTLRRTALTWLASDGHSMSVVQRIARHTSVRMTEAYIDGRFVPLSGVTESISRRLYK